MKRSEHKSIVQELLGMVASDHQARASELLTTLSDDYDQTLTASEQAATNVQNLTNDNENLRKANMKLFLRVGETEKETHKEEDKSDETDEAKPIPFESLFNEKGELI